MIKDPDTGEDRFLLRGIREGLTDLTPRFPPDPERVRMDLPPLKASLDLARHLCPTMSLSDDDIIAYARKACCVHRLAFFDTNRIPATGPGVLSSEDFTGEALRAFLLEAGRLPFPIVEEYTQKRPLRVSLGSPSQSFVLGASEKLVAGDPDSPQIRCALYGGAPPRALAGERLRAEDLLPWLDYVVTGPSVGLIRIPGQVAPAPASSAETRGRSKGPQILGAPSVTRGSLAALDKKVRSVLAGPPEAWQAAETVFTLEALAGRPFSVNQFGTLVQTFAQNGFRIFGLATPTLPEPGQPIAVRGTRGGDALYGQETAEAPAEVFLLEWPISPTKLWLYGTPPLSPTKNFQVR